MSKLKPFISTKHVAPCRVISNYRKLGCIESACLLVSSVESSCCQLVGAAIHHLPGISKKPLHCVSVHCMRADTLALHHTINMNYCDVRQQQQLDTEPSFIGKKKLYSIKRFIFTRSSCNFFHLENQVSIPGGVLSLLGIVW